MAIVGTLANRATLAGLVAAALFADMGCLWASLTAAGVPVHGDVVVLAATAGVLASVVPLVPAGLGLVEAVMPAVLHHFGAPVDAALAGSLIIRGVGTFLPAGVGAGVVAGLLLARRRGRTRQRGAAREAAASARQVVVEPGSDAMPPDRLLEDRLATAERRLSALAGGRSLCNLSRGGPPTGTKEAEGRLAALVEVRGRGLGAAASVLSSWEDSVRRRRGQGATVARLSLWRRGRATLLPGRPVRRRARPLRWRPCTPPRAPARRSGRR